MDRLCFVPFLALSSFLFLSTRLPAPAVVPANAFTYQGRLQDGATAADGTYDLRFAVYDAAEDGTQQGSTVTNFEVAVSGGLFSVALDFGPDVFTGPGRWLELAVRTNGGAAFTILAPRQALTPAPYSLYAANAASAAAVSATNVVGTLAPGQLPGNFITNGQPEVSLSGIFYGNGAGITNLVATNLVYDWPSIQRATNYQHLPVGCDTNLAYIHGASNYSTFGVPLEGSAANGVYYPAGDPPYLDYTNANGLHWYKAPNDDPDWAGAWVITTDTNVPLPATAVWYGTGEPCGERPSITWFDLDGNTYVNLGDFATNSMITNEVYAYFYTNVALSSDRGRFINAQNWGIQTDGSDQTTAINALFQYVLGPNPPSQNIYFPPGSYYVPGGLRWTNNTYPARSFKIVGAGMGATVFNFGPSANSIGLVISGGYGDVFQDFTVSGPQQDGVFNGNDFSVGVLIQNNNSDQLRNVEAWGWAEGFDAINDFGLFIDGCKVYPASRRGIKCVSSHATLIRQTQVTGPHQPPTEHQFLDRGISFEGAIGDDATIINCTIELCTNLLWNNGEVGLHVISSHLESGSSIYTATSQATYTSTHFDNVYILQQVQDLAGAYPALFNVSAMAARYLTLDSLNIDVSSFGIPVVNISDPGNLGYYPPAFISGSGNSIKVIYGGATNDLYSLTSPINGFKYRVLTNPIVSGVAWTNNTGGRGTLVLNYTVNDLLGASAGLCMTNLSNGDFFNATNGIVVVPGTIPGRTTFDMSPNDLFIAIDRSDGTASTSLDRSMFFIK